MVKYTPIDNTPLHVGTLHKYPPAKDNPGRVSEGTARDMAKRAEIYHSQITQADVTGYLRTQKSTKKQRKARRSK